MIPAVSEHAHYSDAEKRADEYADDNAEPHKNLTSPTDFDIYYIHSMP